MVRRRNQNAKSPESSLSSPENINRSSPLTTGEFTKRTGIVGGVILSLMACGIVAVNHLADQKSEQFAKEAGDEIEERFNKAKANLIDDLQVTFREELERGGEDFQEIVEIKVDEVQQAVLLAFGLPANSLEERESPTNYCPLVLIECAGQQG